MHVENRKHKTVKQPSQELLGLKKPMSEYTLEDIPHLHEEITKLFSDLLEIGRASCRERV